MKRALDSIYILEKETQQNNKSIEDLKEKNSLLKENLKTLKGQFDNVITQNLLERKELVEESKKQEDQIREILKELKGL